MSIRFYVHLILLGLLAFAVMAFLSASAAANSVPPASLGDIRRSIAPDDLKPSACSAQHVTKLIADTGVFTGTSGNDLIFGGSGSDIISGGGGDDCILGGGGVDTIIGGTGTDTCIGGTGVDVLDPTCETAVQ
jgi:Ca2+-binding RTX toxin-like protein